MGIISDVYSYGSRQMGGRMFALALISNTTFACLHFSSFTCQEAVCCLSPFVQESDRDYRISHLGSAICVNRSFCR